MLRKLLSALLSLFVLAAISIAAYFNQEFVLHQVDKVKGIYYVYKGDKAYKNLEMTQAIKYYNQGLALYPSHYSAWCNLGNIYVAYEDYNSALHAYSQAFKYNPRMMIARMNYGIISSEKLGDFDSAINQYDEVINTKRHLLSIPYVYNNKVSFKENKAIAYYNKGVTYKLKSVYTNADWEERRKYLSLAIEAYENSIKINPKSYDAQYNLALAYHTIGDYDRAGKCYCNAIKVAPMNYEAHYNLALLLRKLQYYKESYDEIDKALTLVTALDENYALQDYVATVMNDITRNYYQNDEYKRYLKMVLEEEKRKTAQNMTKEDKDKIEVSKADSFTRKKSKKGESEDAILENFGQCSAISYFDSNYSDD